MINTFRLWHFGRKSLKYQVWFLFMIIYYDWIWWLLNSIFLRLYIRLIALWSIRINLICYFLFCLTLLQICYLLIFLLTINIFFSRNISISDLWTVYSLVIMLISIQHWRNILNVILLILIIIRIFMKYHWFWHMVFLIVITFLWIYTRHFTFYI